MLSPNFPATDWEKYLALLHTLVISAVSERVHGFSSFCVPISLEGILQDGKAGDCITVPKLGSPQSRCGVGVRCGMNVVFSGPFFVGFQSPQNCKEIRRTRLEAAWSSLA